MKKTLLLSLLLLIIGIANGIPMGNAAANPPGMIDNNDELFKSGTPLTRTEKPVDAERWQAIYRQAKAIYYMDKPSFQKQVFSQQRSPGDPPPVQYLVWLKMAGQDDYGFFETHPQKFAINCWTRQINEGDVPPESTTEVIYNYFCLSRDAQNTLGYVPPAAPAQRLPAQQGGDPTGTIIQGAQLIRSFIPAR